MPTRPIGTEPTTSTLRAAGNAYAEGRLSIDEVAASLGVTIPDALALLEAQAYSRTVDQLRLTPEQEAARYHAIRRDRLARSGRPARNDALVAREVIASQRIAGIDARRWLSR